MTIEKVIVTGEVIASKDVVICLLSPMITRLSIIVETSRVSSAFHFVISCTAESWVIILCRHLMEIQLRLVTLRGLYLLPLSNIRLATRCHHMTLLH